MSDNINYLHSHSAIERSQKKTLNDKAHVLIDTRYASLFPKDLCEEYKYNGVTYLSVPTVLFLKRGGVFKNLNK